MANERRRYFRINGRIGLSYDLLDQSHDHDPREQLDEKALDIWDRISDQDEKINSLLTELANENPKVAELISTLNQKMERLVRQMVLDSQLVDNLANRVRQVNISACGVAFVNDVDVPLKTRIALDLKLLPKNNIVRANGMVVGCDQTEEGYYWRIDFYDIKPAAQEALIQHIVQKQSEQLRDKNG